MFLMYMYNFIDSYVRFRRFQCVQPNITSKGAVCCWSRDARCAEMGKSFFVSCVYVIITVLRE